MDKEDQKYMVANCCDGDIESRKIVVWSLETSGVLMFWAIMLHSHARADEGPFGLHDVESFEAYSVCSQGDQLEDTCSGLI